jgi:hypothetical protein
MKDNSAFQDYIDRFEEITCATMPVAFLSIDLDELEKRAKLRFHKGYDDLDYLRFAVVELPADIFSLVYHERSPELGVKLCINPRCQNISATIQSAIELLKIEPKYIRWLKESMPENHYRQA